MISTDPPLMRLYQYSSEYKRTIYIATLFSILNKLFDLAPPILIGAAVDIVVRRESSIFAQFGVKNLIDQLIVLAILTFIIWACESIFEYLYKLAWRNLAQVIEHKLRMDAYNHIQTLDMAWFENQKSGGLMSILNDDVNQLERFLDNGANSILQVLTTIITISIWFFIISPPIGAISMIPIPLIIIFSVKFQKKLEPRYAKVRNTVGILNGRLSNNLSGIATIKSYTNEEFEADRVEEASVDYADANTDAIRLSSAFSPMIRMIIVAGFIAMLIVGGMLTLNGPIEVWQYTIIIFLIQRLLWPLTSLGEVFDQYQRAMASTNRALNLLDTKPEIVDGPKSLPRSEVKGKIDINDLSFSYATRSNILTNIDVKIKQGETVAFVGSTGAGKSTIVKLLLRFYDPQEGNIEIDGHDIKELTLKDLRAAIGVVSQDTFIIDGTVRDNIAYGAIEAEMEDIIAAAEIAEIHEFIENLPEGYETLVGERGQKLSGGQRQRISIARAVLKNPPILILDEATSSVDNETEAAIQRSLDKIIVGRTTIVIAHRLSTIVNADQIYVLEDGQIINSGTHEELLAKGEIYAALWRVQTGKKVVKELAD